MKRDTRSSSRTPERALESPRMLLVIGVATAALATAVWVWTTARADGGTTYHLFPLVIGASAGATVGYLSQRPLRHTEAATLALVGFLAVLVGWALLAAIDRWPSGVFTDAIPGGVEGETVLFAAAGALTGGLYAHFRSARSATSEDADA